MKVKLPSGKTEVIDMESATVEELLQYLSISQGEVLVSRDGQIIPVDTVLNREDNIRIMQVVFGG
ncbi:MoaD/ThiS family protein [Methanolobus bombayensis]|uniref:MoaD/ThiS family protein n=1 Tax=Methanolobus bombayensis TaxID=38023 RepID=UPI001AE8005F|nr:MoaD/ThiS family protein [Methanolobus bombayensis]MBP1909403.1 sulfur carrier protein [Methanolobus bombayensis]